MKHGKKYVDSRKAVDSNKQYASEEALSLVCTNAKAKFDETVEAHIRLGVYSRHADQQVRGAVVLPNGTGKKVRVCVFCKENKYEAAQAAGADYVGGQDLVDKITKENWMDFDVVIASPKQRLVRSSIVWTRPTSSTAPSARLLSALISWFRTSKL